MSRLFLACILLFFANHLVADDRIRQVQEELRKRHLYFGDIDGRDNVELQSAVRRYQERKGFNATGEVDQDTAASLGVAVNVAIAAVGAVLPDEPVLKGDFARDLPPQERRALESEGDTANSSPAPPAESPPPADNFSPERVTQFVESYLRDGEINNPAAQTKYYAFPLRYMTDGVRNAAFVEHDAANQIRAWPQRKFILSSPVKLSSTGKQDEARVEFTYAFEEAKNESRIAKGEARQNWTIRADGDQLKITQIDEEIARKR